MITQLNKNQVFVFGSNVDGFHGAGAAGYAMLHVHGNQWRSTKVPGTDKLLSEVPTGTKGYWAVKGTSRGIMEGIHGLGYGIQTVTKPGYRQSITLTEIHNQLLELREHLTYNDYTYIVAPLAVGYGGYTNDDMKCAIESIKWPKESIRFLQLENKHA